MQNISLAAFFGVAKKGHAVDEDEGVAEGVFMFCLDKT